MRRKIILSSLFIILYFIRVQFLPKLDLKDGQIVKVTGTINQEPLFQGNRQTFKIDQFEVTTEKYPELHFGNKVEVTGKVVQNNKSIPLFFSKSYFLSYPNIKILDISKNNPSFKGLAILLGKKWQKLFMTLFPKPYDGIVSGIVIGDKSLINADFYQALKQTGTLHIMVASGMNIALISEGILSILCLFFKRKKAIISLCLLIWFYSFMTGMQLPIVRAAVMASLIYFVQVFGREVNVGRVLIITALIMIYIDPLLIFNIGFQLSFLATLGLVYIQPIIQSSKFKIFNNSNFSSSIASQITTLPILLISFGQFNIISPITNFAVLWVVPFILQLGLLMGLLNFLWIGFAKIASYLIFPFVYYLKQVIYLFDKLEMFQIGLPKIGWWLGVGYYLLIWIWVRKKHC